MNTAIPAAAAACRTTREPQRARSRYPTSRAATSLRPVGGWRSAVLAMCRAITADARCTSRADQSRRLLPHVRGSAPLNYRAITYHHTFLIGLARSTAAPCPPVTMRRRDGAGGGVLYDSGATRSQGNRKLVVESVTLASATSPCWSWVGFALVRELRRLQRRLSLLARIPTPLRTAKPGFLSAFRVAIAAS